MPNKVETYKDLIVWQKSHQLALTLYQSKAAKKEYESLLEVMRGLAADTAANIALGFRNRGKKAKLHFYHAAFNSICRLNYYLTLVNDLEALKKIDNIEEDVKSIEHMLIRLIRSNLSAS
ncbi:MAG: four helix bundle protein [candidate division KSB1 bacterium]|nr:four helix bundle protein [candidate division KSB1 bacterium]